jgi:hypothetical protein
MVFWIISLAVDMGKLKLVRSINNDLSFTKFFKKHTLTSTHKINVIESTIKYVLILYWHYRCQSIFI